MSACALLIIRATQPRMINPPHAGRSRGLQRSLDAAAARVSRWQARVLGRHAWCDEHGIRGERISVTPQRPQGSVLASTGSITAVPSLQVPRKRCSGVLPRA